MDTNEMIALLLPPNGCFACSDTRKEIAEELARRSVDLERECADADKICAALGLTVDKSRTEGGSLNVPRIVGHIQETLTALRESHAFGVAMSDKYVASRAPECAAAQVAWQPIATAPEGRVVLVFYKNQLGNGRTMRARYYLPETLESEQTESGWADEGWYEESEAYEYLMPLEHEPTHWMPMPAAPDAAAPAQAEPQPVSVPYELIAHDKPQPRCGWMHAGDQCALAEGKE